MAAEDRVDDASPLAHEASASLVRTPQRKLSRGSTRLSSERGPSPLVQDVRKRRSSRLQSLRSRKSSISALLAEPMPKAAAVFRSLNTLQLRSPPAALEATEQGSLLPSHSPSVHEPLSPLLGSEVGAGSPGSLPEHEASHSFAAPTPKAPQGEGGTAPWGTSGRLLIILGSMEVHCVSCRALLRSVPVWHLQRQPSPERVDAIAAAVQATLSSQGRLHCPPGVITCFALQGDRRSSIGTPQACGVVDGQHRLLAFQQVLEAPGAPADLDCELLVNLHRVGGDEEVKELFLALNKAESVQEVDLPSRLAPASKQVIDAAVAELASRFPDMFKPSARCRPPHIHADSLRNLIFRQGTVQTRGIKAPSVLVAHLEAVNAQLRGRQVGDWPTALRGKALAKARKYGLFIGLCLQTAVAMLGAV